MLRDSTVVAAVVRTPPRAIPLAMITMRKSTYGFPFVSHIWVAYGAPLLRHDPSPCQTFVFLFHCHVTFFFRENSAKKTS